MPTPRKTTAATEEAVLPGPETPSDGPPPVSPGDPTVAHIGTAQMRQLHAMMRDHGIQTDAAVHAYLSTHLGREVESRRTITAVEAATLLRDLEAAPVHLTPGTGIYKALAAVMAAVDHVAKDGRNTQQNFSFRGVDAVVNAAGPAFRKHQVIVLPVLRSVNYEPMPLSSGKTAMVCRVVVSYQFYAGDGSFVEATVAAEAFDMGDKATPKAMSVAFRTALLQALALPTDEPDPDQENFEAAPGQRQATPPPPQARDDGPVYQADEYDEMGTPDLLLVIDRFADAAGKDFTTFTEKWRNDNGGMTVDQMDDLPPEVLRPYVRKVRDFMATQGAGV